MARVGIKLAATALAAVLALALGCRGESTEFDGSLREVRWQLGAKPKPNDRILAVTFESGYCTGDQRLPRFEEISVAESASEVTVAAILRRFPHYGQFCAGVGYPLVEVVRLEAPLGSRSIVRPSGTTVKPEPKGRIMFCVHASRLDRHEAIRLARRVCPPRILRRGRPSRRAS